MFEYFLTTNYERNSFNSDISTSILQMQVLGLLAETLQIEQTLKPTSKAQENEKVKKTNQ